MSDPNKENQSTDNPQEPLNTGPIQLINDDNYLYTPDDTWTDLDEQIVLRMIESEDHHIHKMFTDDDKLNMDKMLAKGRKFWYNKTATPGHERHDPRRTYVKPQVKNNVLTLSDGSKVPYFDAKTNPDYKKWLVDSVLSDNQHLNKSNFSYPELYLRHKNPNKYSTNNQVKLKKEPFNLTPDTAQTILEGLDQSYEELIESYKNKLLRGEIPTQNEIIAFTNRHSLRSNEEGIDAYTQRIIDQVLSGEEYDPISSGDAISSLSNYEIPNNLIFDNLDISSENLINPGSDHFYHQDMVRDIKYKENYLANTPGYDAQGNLKVWEVKPTDGYMVYKTDNIEQFPYIGSANRNAGMFENERYTPAQHLNQEQHDAIVKALTTTWTPDMDPIEKQKIMEHYYNLYSSGYRLVDGEGKILDPILPNGYLIGEPDKNGPLHATWKSYEEQRDWTDPWKDIFSSYGREWVGFAHETDDYYELGRLMILGQALNNDKELSDEEMAFVADWLYRNAWMSEGTTSAKFWESVHDLPPYAMEIAVALAGSTATFGVAGATYGAKLIAGKSMKELVKTLVSKKVRNKVSKWASVPIVKNISSSTAKKITIAGTSLGIQNFIHKNAYLIPEWDPENETWQWFANKNDLEALRIMMPNFAIDPDANSIIMQASGIDEETAYKMANRSNTITFLSEKSGAYFLKPMLSWAKPAIKNYIHYEKFVQALMRKNPLDKFIKAGGTKDQWHKAMSKYLALGGYDGLLEEWLEERVDQGARHMHHVLAENGLIDSQYAEMGWEWQTPTLEEFMIELGTLAVPMVGGKTIANANAYYKDKVFNKSEIGPKIIKETEDNDSNLSENLDEYNQINTDIDRKTELVDQDDSPVRFDKETQQWTFHGSTAEFFKWQEKFPTLVRVDKNGVPVETPTKPQVDDEYINVDREIDDINQRLDEVNRELDTVAEEYNNNENEIPDNIYNDIRSRKNKLLLDLKRSKLKRLKLLERDGKLNEQGRIELENLQNAINIADGQMDPDSQDYVAPDNTDTEMDPDTEYEAPVQDNTLDESGLPNQFDDVTDPIHIEVEALKKRREELEKLITDRKNKKVTLKFAELFLRQNPFYFDKKGLIEVIEKINNTLIEEKRAEGMSDAEINAWLEQFGSSIDKFAGVAGSTEWEGFEEEVKVLIKFYTGANADTVIEEFMGFAYMNMSAEQKQLFRDYWKSQDTMLNEQEFFEKQAKTFYWANNPSVKYSGLSGKIRSIYESMKDNINKLLDRHDEQIDPRLRQMYIQAGLLKPIKIKDIKTPLDTRTKIDDPVDGQGTGQYVENIAYINGINNYIYINEDLDLSPEDFYDENGNLKPNVNEIINNNGVGYQIVNEDVDDRESKSLSKEDITEKLSTEWNEGDVIKYDQKMTDEEKVESVNAMVNYGHNILTPDLDDPSYGGYHRPMEGPPANDMFYDPDGEGAVSPKDIFENPQYYMGSTPNEYNEFTPDIPKGAVYNDIIEFMNYIKQNQGNPDATITIYRAGPKNELNGGDWVTPSYHYALGHSKHHEDPALDDPVHSFEVKLSDILWDGNSLEEWGYFPKSQYNLSEDWWTQHVANIIRDLKGSVLPQLENIDVDDVFKIVLSATSLNTGLEKNYDNAVDAVIDYAQSLNPADINTQKSSGKSYGVDAITFNIEKYKAIVNHFGSVEKARAWLLSPHKKKEVLDLIHEIGGERVIEKGKNKGQMTWKYKPDLKGNADDLIYPALVLGPKIGRMYLAMHGIEGQAPFDLWMNRFYEVATGDIFYDKEGKLKDAPRNETIRQMIEDAIYAITNDLKELGYDIDYGGTQASLWVNMIDIFNQHKPVPQRTDWNEKSKEYIYEYEKFKTDPSTSKYLEGLDESAIQRIYATYQSIDEAGRKTFQETGKLPGQAGDKKINYQITNRTPGYYDRTYIGVVNKFKEGKVTFDSLIPWIKGNIQGVTNLELQQLGLLDWVKNNKGLVSKDDLLSYLETNNVSQINVRYLGTIDANRSAGFLTSKHDPNARYYIFNRNEIEGDLEGFQGVSYDRIVMDNVHDFKEFTNDPVFQDISELVDPNDMIAIYVSLNEDRVNYFKEFPDRLTERVWNNILAGKITVLTTEQEDHSRQMTHYNKWQIEDPEGSSYGYHEILINPDPRRLNRKKLKQYDTHWEHYNLPPNYGHIRAGILLDNDKTYYRVMEIQSDYEQGIKEEVGIQKAFRNMQIESGQEVSTRELVSSPYPDFNYVNLAIKEIINQGLKMNVDAIMFPTAEEVSKMFDFGKLENITYMHNNNPYFGDDIFNIDMYDVENLSRDLGDGVKVTVKPATWEINPKKELKDKYGVGSIIIGKGLYSGSNKADAFDQYVFEKVIPRLIHNDNFITVTGDLIDLDGDVTKFNKKITPRRLVKTLGKNIGNAILNDEGIELNSFDTNNDLIEQFDPSGFDVEYYYDMDNVNIINGINRFDHHPFSKAFSEIELFSSDTDKYNHYQLSVSLHSSLNETINSRNWGLKTFPKNLHNYNPLDIPIMKSLKSDELSGELHDHHIAQVIPIFQENKSTGKVHVVLFGFDTLNTRFVELRRRENYDNINQAVNALFSPVGSFNLPIDTENAGAMHISNVLKTSFEKVYNKKPIKKLPGLERDAVPRGMIIQYDEKIKSYVNKLPLLKDTDVEIKENENGNLIIDNLKDKKLADKIAGTDVEKGNHPSYQIKNKEDEIKESIEIKEETAWQWFLYNIQDEMIRMKVIQDQIGDIPEALDVYMKHELYQGRLPALVNTFRDNYKIKIKEMQDDDLGIDDFGKFLYFRHAKERNDYIKEKFDKDNGSGFTYKQIEEYWDSFKQLPQNIQDKFNSYADWFDVEVIGKTRALIYQGGLIDEETYDILNTTYKYYVPLKGVDGEQAFFNTARGYSVPGSGIIRATGRGEGNSADNPFLQALADHEHSMQLVEKNKVTRALHDLIEENPSDIWSVEGSKYLPRYDEDGNVYLDKQRLADNQIAVRIDGKTRVITINDNDLLKAFKSFKGGARSKYTQQLVSAIQMFNAYFRMINTSLRPKFIISNFLRDAQTAGIHMTEKMGFEQIAKSYGGVMSAVAGIFKSSRGYNSDWSQWYKEFQEDGGQVGWMDQLTVEDKMQDIDKELRKLEAGNFKQALYWSGQMIEDVNMAVENGIRLMVYRKMRESGVTREKSAQFAKNLTVNFNKKGAMGPLMNMIYVFSNAGVQGSARFLSSIKNNPKTRAMVAGIFAHGFLNSLMNRMMRPDDDEEAWDAVSDWEKDGHIMVPMPGSNRSFALKLGYGINVPHAMGVIIEDLIAGQEWYQNLLGLSPGSGITYGTAIKRFIGSIDQGFNPFGSGSPGQMITPTMFKPIVGWIENKKWNGIPIYKEPFPGVPPGPDYLQHWPSVREKPRQFTKWLYNYTDGAVDINPETIDHFVDGYGGGLARDIIDAINLGDKAFSDGTLPPAEAWPIADLFIKDPKGYGSKGVVYEIYNGSNKYKFTDDDRNRFYKHVELALKTDVMDAEKGYELIRAFRKNQFKEFGIKHPKPGEEINEKEFKMLQRELDKNAKNKEKRDKKKKPPPNKSKDTDVRKKKDRKDTKKNKKKNNTINNLPVWERDSDVKPETNNINEGITPWKAP